MTMLDIHPFRTLWIYFILLPWDSTFQLARKRKTPNEAFLKNLTTAYSGTQENSRMLYGTWPHYRLSGSYSSHVEIPVSHLRDIHLILSIFNFVRWLTMTIRLYYDGLRWAPWDRYSQMITIVPLLGTILSMLYPVAWLLLDLEPMITYV